MEGVLVRRNLSLQAYARKARDPRLTEAAKSKLRRRANGHRRIQSQHHAGRLANVYAGAAVHGQRGIRLRAAEPSFAVQDVAALDSILVVDE